MLERRSSSPLIFTLQYPWPRPKMAASRTGSDVPEIAALHPLPTIHASDYRAPPSFTKNTVFMFSFQMAEHSQRLNFLSGAGCRVIRPGHSCPSGTLLPVRGPQKGPRSCLSPPLQTFADFLIITRGACTSPHMLFTTLRASVSGPFFSRLQNNNFGPVPRLITNLHKTHRSDPCSSANHQPYTMGNYVSTLFTPAFPPIDRVSLTSILSHFTPFDCLFEASARGLGGSCILVPPGHTGRLCSNLPLVL